MNTIVITKILLNIIYNLSFLKEEYKDYISIKNNDNKLLSTILWNIYNFNKQYFVDINLSDSEVTDIINNLNINGNIKIWVPVQNYILIYSICYNNDYINFIKYDYINEKVVENIIYDPGTIINIDKEYIEVLCGEFTILKITELQLENKKKMTVKEYLNGNNKLTIGTKFN